MTHKCGKCHKTNIPLLKIGKGQCRICNNLLFISGSQEYKSLIEYYKNKVKRPGFD